MLRQIIITYVFTLEMDDTPCRTMKPSYFDCHFPVNITI